MTMSKKVLKKVAVLLVLVVSLSLLASFTTPRVTANPASLLITPIDGVVGDSLVAHGTIDTINGSFTVRWNQAINFTGTAVDNNATKSFVIPPTIGAPRPLGRNVTVELIDEALDSVVAATSFTLFTAFDVRVDVPPSPKQLREGNATSIRVNVTGGLPNMIYAANVTIKNPANQTHSTIMSLSNTTTTGSAGGAKVYPTGFSGAHTNLTGTYFVAFNGTLATAEFFVGLTDKTEYRRNENVLVQAAGYKPSEKVKVDIRTVGSVSGFPQNSTASSSGLVTLSWKVQVNATPGTYHMVFTNTTVNGTVKTPTDAQDFAILGVACLIQARNLADEAVESALINVYNASATTTALNTGNTNSTGWIRFNLDEGNYTLKAFFKNVQVGLRANELIMADTELNMSLSLTNFLATVRTKIGDGVPLINVALKENKTGTEAAVGQTNASGMAAIRNLFTNRTYRVEATRYGLLFSNTTVDVVPFPEGGWIIRNLTLPNHTLSVHTIDSEDNGAAGVDIRIYEWASGIATPVDSATTNSSGDVFFSLPFGKYILRAFKGDDFLREAVVGLDEPTTFTFDLVTLNVNVVVSVLDYFGQPLANAEVQIERKISQDFVLVSTTSTDAAGIAQFGEMVGGDSRVSVYLGGTLVAVKTQFLGAGSSEVAIRVAEYVAVVGYPLQTGTFALLIFILVLIVVVLVATRRRVIQLFRRSSKR
jgi:5-hydroxyisourate hydrolase-like protein (transthyretin family)